MQFLIVALAGVVQGITEWIPISSKTLITLILATAGYRFETAYVLGLIANFGSFFAALWYFRSDVRRAVIALPRALSAGPDPRLLRFVVIATVATGVIGIPAYLGVVAAFQRTTGTVVMIGIGVLLLVTGYIGSQRERLARAQQGTGDPTQLRVPGTKASLLVGACQGLAALPGISRSAVTVTPLLWMGYTSQEALRLSFLLDVLALLAAGLVPFVFGHQGMAALHAVGLGPTLVLLAVSAVVSVFAIDAILKLMSRFRSSVLATILGVLTIGGAFLLEIH